MSTSWWYLHEYLIYRMLLNLIPQNFIVENLLSVVNAMLSLLNIVIRQKMIHQLQCWCDIQNKNVVDNDGIIAFDFCKKPICCWNAR